MSNFRLDPEDKAIASYRDEPWRHYRHKDIPKDDGTTRRLSIPRSDLGSLQRLILDRILIDLPKHPADHSRAGRSVVTNAEVHVGHRYFSKFDIEKCFPSISPRLVRRALIREGLSALDAQLIASLTTYRGELPQGAPTSSALLGLVLFPADEWMASAATRHGVSYTRYADDIFISANRPLSFVRDDVGRAAAEAGLRINSGKTRHWTPATRATFAGVVLATKPTIDVGTLLGVDRLIHRISTGQDPVTEKGIQSLRGRIAWITQLRPTRGNQFVFQLAAALDKAERCAGASIPTGIA